MDKFFIGFGFGGLFWLIISAVAISDCPTPMDVYQGKTTLKYEVVDGIAVDSVVIFKNQ